MRARLFATRLVAVVCLAVLASGCSGGGALSFRGTIPAEYRHAVRAALVPDQSLAFPALELFNVHDKRSAQTPAPAGQARADASAQPTGQAAAQASTDRGGSAWGEFQLGHCLHNHTGQPLLADLEFSVDYEASLECRVPAQAATSAPATRATAKAEVSLQVLVKDANETVLRTMDLLHITNDQGRVARNGHATPRFSVQFDPNLAYTLVIVGRASADADPDADAAAELVVRRLAITVTGRSRQ